MNLLHIMYNIIQHFVSLIKNNNFLYINQK